MASISNKLWKYNRYRYIMTYQERPWLPPPLILLSHMALALRYIYWKFLGDTEPEERGSGLKLPLGHEDRKKLHEFEKKMCRAERTEEMSAVVLEISDKVNFIQHSLSELDCQMGQLQDLSALAVDTLTLLSASDSLQKEEARLAQCRVNPTLQHVLPHSWTLPHRSNADCDVPNFHQLVTKSCKSTPPSLLKGSVVAASRMASLERHMGSKGSKEEKHKDTEREEETREDSQCGTRDHPVEKWLGGSKPSSHASFTLFNNGKIIYEGERQQTPSESCGSSSCESPLSPRALGSPPQRSWACDPYLYPSLEDTSMEEQEECDSEEQDDTKEHLTDSEGDRLPSFVSKRSSQWRRPSIAPRWLNMPKKQYYDYSRSLSSSMENITFSGAPLSPTRGSFFTLNEAISKEKITGRRGFIDDTCLSCSRSQEWSKSSDFIQVSGTRAKGQNRKTVKIKESSFDTEGVQPDPSDASWRRRPKFIGEPTCWSASTSLSQLNFDPPDMMLKQMVSHQEVWSPTHPGWNSRAKSVSRRSSLQSGIPLEVKSLSFQSSENLYPHYSATERNNLMRLAQTIPFTPISIFGGEEVSVYSLEEAPSDADADSPSAPSWSSKGLSAILQPLSSEEGSLDGGLRQGCRMLCTWAEQDVLKPGSIYVVKAFKSEVVRVWQKYFPGSTALQLCLREIQQQRAAQKMMHVFNQIKPQDMRHSPRFLDVFLILWHSNGQWLTIERNMTGDFRKYNNNTGEEITPCSSLEDMLLAFSHWTYEYSCEELLVLDIQGVGDELTDPTVIMADDQSCKGELLFGPDNLGVAAINGFLQKHTCNLCCHRLGLKDLRTRPTNSEISSEAGRASRKEE
ncbi:hypothetical protein OJAV_G00091930 [Oryzias javanicus]|uniref:non-specific serine/threonine protein kinase n=1 Tax=Oryzias javanicus TaxID=123683 RepID=A0A3S2MJR4_ORYJA|nr:hypothetical protein OJAV_G00091930 [Oryzias javanicus]